MKTIGERRVRTEFNPSEDTLVDQIKQKTAEVMNLIDEMRAPKLVDGHGLTDEEKVYSNGEFYRLKSLAMTEYETAAMWAVKAATYQHPKP